MVSTLKPAIEQRLVAVGRCPECNSQELVTDKNLGEILCKRCGLVIKELMLDQTPEWRAFTLEEKEAKMRVGAPTPLNPIQTRMENFFQ
jgi:transcription initiation factor TFIIIB Brf1 subunit/transcription initiation factor TFIIB